jgi:enamine deaminase RidA (YjgF/YER057c/UK114 family)
VSTPTSPHRVVNPPSLAPASGFAHAVVASPGRLVFLGGQAALDVEGKARGETIVAQFEVALENVVEALRAAGASPEHLVSMQIFVTDVGEYRASLTDIGVLYRNHFGRHYPAMALFEVARLFEERCRVELVCIAVVPEEVA